MLSFSTIAKLRVLRGLRRAVVTGRALAGQTGTRVEVRRGGLRWSLDLNEGIDFSIFLIGRFELMTSRVIASLLRPGMVVLDIGANIGAHALPMAKAVGPSGRVYAIEPTRWAHDLLVANRALNPELDSSLVVLHAMLTGKSSVVPRAFHSSWNLGAPKGDEHPVHRGSLREIGQAQVLTLDQLVEQRGLTRLDLIKIDVDGWECDIFESGENTLDRFGPPMVMELAPHVLEEHGSSLDKLVNFVRGHGYELLHEWSRRPLPSSLKAVRRLIPEGGSMNVLAMRRSRG